MLRDEIKLDTSDWFAVNEKIMSILKFIVNPIFLLILRQQLRDFKQLDQISIMVD